MSFELIEDRTPVISPLAQQIEDLLPQTQCTKCGFEGCAPYARAIADGSADFNQCPPGGQEGIERLAKLLHRAPQPLNPDNGFERPRHLAVIDESVCIGCTLCIQACPVDAIIGAAKQIHTVLAADCTGCDLCVAPCPVDCIDMVPVSGDATGWQAWSAAQAQAARAHYTRHQHRLAAEKAAAADRAQARSDAARQAATDAPPVGQPADAADRARDAADATVHDAAAEAAARKKAIIQAAVERARLRRVADAAEAAMPPDSAAATTPPDKH